jgi:hypothetical protein
MASKKSTKKLRKAKKIEATKSLIVHGYQTGGSNG